MPKRNTPRTPIFAAVPLPGGAFAIVDLSDAERVSMHRWHLHKNRSRRYARTEIAGRKVYLHRFIVEAEPGSVFDHISGDGLDCRRSNIRPATFSQNCQNTHARVGFKGVRHPGPNKKKWAAHIKVHGTRRLIGSYETEEDAAHAYDNAAREVFGSFARLNFPRKGEQSA